jgi:hypothetical protein
MIFLLSSDLEIAYKLELRFLLTVRSCYCSI